MARSSSCDASEETEDPAFGRVSQLSASVRVHASCVGPFPNRAHIALAGESELRSC